MKAYNGLTILFACFCLIHAEQKSDGVQTREKNFSLGFQLHDFNDDLGCGLNLTFPWFGNKRVGLRYSGDVVFSKLNGWKPYGSSRLGFVGSSGLVKEFCRFYSEGGLQILIMTSDLSDDNVAFGGYGHFGFEFFLNPENHSPSYYIELGSSGIYVHADKLAGEPMYFNGFCTGVGMRYYF